MTRIATLALTAALLLGAPASAMGVPLGDLTPRLDFPEPVTVPLSTKGAAAQAD
ncbi:hypothetical protein ACK8OR_10225 [Jannaschia sp. KMU-145]|uniref:hypothetical protein n=1 Tax=Jannaschia halovivens TaxID=3388667 RepID=UPI00396B0126